jgi:hypothetical protein
MSATPATSLQFKLKSSGLLGDRQCFFPLWELVVTEGGGEALAPVGRRKFICSPWDLRRVRD